MSQRRKAQQEQTAQKAKNVPVRILVFAALALAFLTHIAAAAFPFVDDDGMQIQSNLHVQSWDFLPKYFTADVWSHTGCGSSNYYRPLFLLWLRLNHVFFGLDPAGWHVAAILLHVLAAGLVFLLAGMVLKDKIAAGFAAALFAVHPITVEGVVWVSGATEALSGVLVFGCLLCHLRGSRWSFADGRWPETAKPGVWRVAALVLFALALLAKETAIVIPILVMVYELAGERWSSEAVRPKPNDQRPTTSSRETGDRGRGTKESFLALVPYAAVLAAYLALRFRVMHGLAPDKFRVINPATAIATWPAVLWFYLRKLVIPWPLSLHYSLSFVSHIGVREVVLPLVALLAVAAGLWYWARRDSRVLLASAWLLIPLLPSVAGTLRFGPWQLVHDRYLYVSLAGFAMLCALGVRSLAGRPSPVPRPPSPEPRQDVSLQQGVVLVAVLLIWGVTTASYIRYWSGGLALYGRAVAVAPDNPVAQNALGEEFLNHSQLEEGLQHLRQSVAEDPGYFSSRLSLGHAYGFRGDWTNAIAQLRLATQLRPTACAFANLADAQKGAGLLTEAESSYRYAASLRPCPWHLHYAIAELMLAEGRLAEARKEFQLDFDEPSDSPAPDVAEKIQELDRRLQGR